MKILPCALTILTLCLSAAEAGEPVVKVEHGWIQAVPPVAGDSVAYLTLVNLSDHELRLTHATTPIAETVMPMVTVKTIRNGSEIVGMKEVDELVVPAHGRLFLVPSGSHLMLMKLKVHPALGKKVPLTLRFEPGNITVTTELPVSLLEP